MLVLREIEKRLGLAARLAGCLSDARDPASTTHSYADMIGARMFAIACGYEDCDDLDVLRFDPAFKLACGRLPESGRDLMSQPTLSRLENAPSWRELARLGLTMIDLFCDSFERVPQRIVLDIDDTLMPSTAASNWHCSTPITTSTAFSPSTSSTRRPPSRCCRCCVRASGHPVTRRRGSCATSSAASGAIGPGSRSRCVATAITARPRSWTCWRIRATATFSGLPGNARLSEIGQPWCEDAALRRVQSGKDKVRRFFQTGYQAKSWSRERKVVARVEATARGTDVRFVVTNLPAAPNCSTRGSIAPVAGWKT